MITVTVPAPSRKLTNVDPVRRDLGITTSDHNVTLDAMIEQASYAIESHCNRVFAQETVQETLPASSGHILMLSRTPVIGVESVLYNGVALPSQDYVITEADAGFLFSPRGWNDTSQSGYGVSRAPVQGSRAYLYTVTYTAGYVLPSFPSASVTLPRDIERACIDLVKSMWFTRRHDQNIASESVPDVGSRSYRNVGAEDSALPPSVTSILNRWKRAV